MKRISNIEFINKAIKCHGDRYDYSNVHYVNSRTVVKILCNRHGCFEQTPSNHLAGQNCPVCMKRGKSNNKRFVISATDIHGNKYDYSKVEYINNRTKIKIICQEHGLFEQLPTGHLNGDGCPKCNGGVVINVGEFIERAIRLHGTKYDYSDVKYINSQTKIRINCPEHGVFIMKPNNHLSGQECPECNNKSKGEKIIKNWLNKYSINFETQKTFEGCKNERLLRFDFYLPDKDILIEYDGEQHYKSIKFFGGDDGLKYIQLNDRIKTSFARDNNINLLRITHDERKNLSEVLENNIII